MVTAGSAVVLLFLAVDIRLAEAQWQLKLFSSRLSWTDANAHCQSLGMTLAFLDLEANLYMEEMMQYSDFIEEVEDDFWIGIFDSDYEDESRSGAGYSWAMTCGSLESSWTSWKDGEPQNTQDCFCVAMFKDFTEWRSATCSEERPFLCGKRTSACQYHQTDRDRCSFTTASTQEVVSATSAKCQRACETGVDQNDLSRCWFYEFDSHHSPACTLTYGNQAPVCDTDALSDRPDEYRRSCVSFSLNTSSTSGTGSTSDFPPPVCRILTTVHTTERESTSTESVTSPAVPETSTTESVETTTMTTEQPVTTVPQLTTQLTTSSRTLSVTTTTTHTNDVEANTTASVTSTETVTFVATTQNPESGSSQSSTAATDGNSGFNLRHTTNSSGTQSSPTSVAESSSQTVYTTRISTSGTPPESNENDVTTSSAHGKTSSEVVQTTFSSLAANFTQETATDSAPTQWSNSQCKCRCTRQNASSVALSLWIDSIIEELRVDVANLSSTRRKKESASDQRTSSAFISIFCIALLMAALGTVVLMDVPAIYRHLKNGLSCRSRTMVGYNDAKS